MRTFRIVLLLSAAACGASQSSDTVPPPAAEPAAEPAAAEAEPPAPEPPGWAAEAAERGAALYGDKCATCHGDAGQGQAKAPPLVGKDALPLQARPGSKRGVQFKTALDVLGYIKATMPADAPGTLTDDDARAILAFDLKANGVDLTGKDLSDQTLAAIALH